uniref:F-box associated beta-propeller type 1 domain-containing protein n=1 Tax=Brassica oleracea var. oleracea TaxID=109376 RepID=A0A0D3BMW6_BRAOL
MSKAARESMLLSNYEVYSIPGDLHELYNSGVVEPDIEFTGKLWVDLYMYAIYHCDGLMLCQTEDNPRLVVWNPCTGQTRLIEPRTFYSNYDRCALGYSSTSSRRSYKILRCCSYRNDKRVKLAVSCTVAGSDVMRIWITNKIDDDKEAKDLSWRTDFVLQVDCAKYNVSMENFLLDEENKVAVCCGKYHKNGYVTMIYIVGEDMYKQVYELCSNLHNWPLSSPRFQAWFAFPGKRNGG